jgi:hypothetical protein
MLKFLIEVPHRSEKYECLRSVKIFLTSGSHFLANADWGCLDGEHKAWFIMEAENKDEVIQVVPQPYRKDAKILQLNKFRIEDIDELLKRHQE